MRTGIVFTFSCTNASIISPAVQFTKFNHYRFNILSQSISPLVNYFPLVLQGLLLFPDPELVHVLFPLPYKADISTISGFINFIIQSPHFINPYR